MVYTALLLHAVLSIRRYTNQLNRWVNSIIVNCWCSGGREKLTIFMSVPQSENCSIFFPMQICWRSEGFPTVLPNIDRGRWNQFLHESSETVNPPFAGLTSMRVRLSRMFALRFMWVNSAVFSKCQLVVVASISSFLFVFSMMISLTGLSCAQLDLYAESVLRKWVLRCFRIVRNLSGFTNVRIFYVLCLKDGPDRNVVLGWK